MAPLPDHLKQKRAYNKHHVLLVEDEPKIADIIELALDDIAYVVHADSAITALGMDWRDFSLILLDWRLEDRTARDILNMAEIYYPDLPVIIYTGDLDAAAKLRMEDKYPVFIKPDIEGVVNLLIEWTQMSSS